MTAATALQAVVSGLAHGSVYGLIAMGFALTYGATRLVSLAHGDTVGASVTVGIATVLGASPTAASPRFGSSLLVVLITLLASAFVGLVLYLVAVRPFLTSALASRSALMSWVGAGLALGLVLRELVLTTFSRDTTAVPDALHLGWFSSSGVVSLGTAHVAARSFGVIVVGVLLAVAVDTWLRRSPSGAAVQAICSEPTAAALVGLPARVLLPRLFVLAGLLCGLAGLLGLPGEALTASSGVILGLKAAAAAALWRLGSPRAAFAGGLVLGVIESLAVAQWGAQLSDVLALGLLVVLLAVRPLGLRVRPLGEVA